ncbi:hypothetical protein ACFQ0B_16100 [Nonomuraea thailandensis]
MPSDEPVGRVMVPLTWMTYGPGRAMWSRNWAVVVTVTVGPPAPPVVPFWPRALTAANPMGPASATEEAAMVAAVEGGRQIRGL